MAKAQEAVKRRAPQTHEEPCFHCREMVRWSDDQLWGPFYTDHGQIRHAECAIEDRLAKHDRGEERAQPHVLAYRRNWKAKEARELAKADHDAGLDWTVWFPALHFPPVS